MEIKKYIASTIFLVSFLICPAADDQNAISYQIISDEPTGVRLLVDVFGQEVFFSPITWDLYCKVNFSWDLHKYLSLGAEGRLNLLYTKLNNKPVNPSPVYIAPNDADRDIIFSPFYYAEIKPYLTLNFHHKIQKVEEDVILDISHRYSQKEVYGDRTEITTTTYVTVPSKKLESAGIRIGLENITAFNKDLNMKNKSNNLFDAAFVGLQWVESSNIELNVIGYGKQTAFVHYALGLDVMVGKLATSGLSLVAFMNGKIVSHIPATVGLALIYDPVTKFGMSISIGFGLGWRTGLYKNVSAPHQTGPAGGLVFYDKGEYSNGWRYLEATPSDISTDSQWYKGNFKDWINIKGTGDAIGTGKANTAVIVAAQGSGSYAAALCDDLVLGGFDDWFLPSKDELNLLYTKLHKKGLGGFTFKTYWSSSHASFHNVWGQNFKDGRQFTFSGWGQKAGDHVRAVRAF